MCLEDDDLEVLMMMISNDHGCFDGPPLGELLCRTLFLHSGGVSEQAVVPLYYLDDFQCHVRVQRSTMFPSGMQSTEKWHACLA